MDWFIAIFAEIFCRNGVIYHCISWDFVPKWSDLSRYLLRICAEMERFISIFAKIWCRNGAIYHNILLHLFSLPKSPGRARKAKAPFTGGFKPVTGRFQTPFEHVWENGFSSAWRYSVVQDYNRSSPMAEMYWIEPKMEWFIQIFAEILCRNGLIYPYICRDVVPKWIDLSLCLPRFCAEVEWFIPIFAEMLCRSGVIYPYALCRNGRIYLHVWRRFVPNSDYQRNKISGNCH